VQQVRGIRPSPQATLAATGVDSLGAVMLVKRFADKFGIRIAPKEAFAAGITVTQFSENIYRRLQIENPSILPQLGIKLDRSMEKSGGGREGDGDYESGYTWRDRDRDRDREGNMESSNSESDTSRGRNSNKNRSTEGCDGDYCAESDLEYTPSAAERAFEERIAANIAYFEGSRGVFAFMILW